MSQKAVLNGKLNHYLTASLKNILQSSTSLFILNPLLLI